MIMNHLPKWLLRVLAGLVLPVLILATLEAALRLGGYGFDTKFFKPVLVGGQKMLVENDSFGFRFFPTETARLPRPTMINARKPVDVYRIFVFGESAAEGDPDPAYGPARFLAVLLQDRFPNQRFEIINVAVTANDSHGILPIARECARLDGDLWIIYMGNNEMIGPFGAAGVFGRPAPPLTLIRASLALKTTRLGQLIGAWTDYLIRHGSSASEWGGLEMFATHHVPPNDPSKDRVYRNFQSNLNDILHVGVDSGAEIILSTVAVNLKDCPPLASENSPKLASSERANYYQLNTKAKIAEDTGDAGTAAKYLEQAAKLDPQNADLQYRWGLCLMQMTNFVAARTHLQLACDNDAVPARADSRINEIIRESASQFSDGSLTLFESTKALTTTNAMDFCGSETFYEHVHFKPRGSYRLGLAWAEQVANHLPEAAESQTSTSWASEALCERYLAMTDWNRQNDLNEMVSRRHSAPLCSQSNNTQMLAELQDELAVLRKRMDRDGAIQARHICLEAIQRAPQDMDLHCNYADFLEAVGDFQEAAEQWLQVQQIRPEYFLGYFQRGRMLEKLGQLELARGDFIKTISLRPIMAPAWFELSNIDASAGDFDLALEEAERASRLQPHLAIYYACMGKILSRMGRHSLAIARYHQALQVDGNYWEGHVALGRELANVGEFVAAQTEFEDGIRLRPDSALAYLELGIVLARQGQWDAANHQIENAIQLDPSNQQAEALLSQIRLSQNGGEHINFK
jgi:tetratricopeptide (TPR) repeat protein